MNGSDIVERLERATHPKRLLEHTFYKAWADGRLSRGDLSFYAAQYWRQVESFPSYLDELAERLPDGVARDVLRENLADERDGDHPGLWLRFAAAVGAGDRTVENSEAEPETEACVEAFRAACSSGSPAFVLGMLFGYESQTPKVAKTKVEGLREHYGIDGDAVEYFELHGELDVEHSAELVRALSSLGDDDSIEADAEAGAAAGADAVWRLLDGVVRVRGIAA